VPLAHPQYVAKLKQSPDKSEVAVANRWLRWVYHQVV